MSAIVQPWLINRFFDPIFAIAMGFSAAALRVKREESAKRPRDDTSYPVLWQTAVARGKIYFGMDR